MEEAIIFLLDIFGTGVFAATGAIKGIRKHLDIFGISVLSCCVGVGGGMMRDTILGAVPVAALQHWCYLAICIGIGFAIFFSARYWMKFRNIIQICDALGLGVFTAIGAAKGISFEISMVGVLLCGVITAIGGGIIRDVLSGEIPTVLKSDFYATASLLGGLLYYILNKCSVPWFINFLLTAAFVTAVRLCAMRLHLQLPEVHSSRD